MMEFHVIGVWSLGLVCNHAIGHLLTTALTNRAMSDVIIAWPTDNPGYTMLELSGRLDN